MRLHGGPVLAELTARFGEQARAKVLAGEVVDADGAVIDAATMLPPGSSVYLYRDLPDEVPVPFDILVLHQDDRTSSWSTSHTFWPPCHGGGTSRRRRWCDFAGNWDCPN